MQLQSPKGSEGGALPASVHALLQLRSALALAPELRAALQGASSSLLASVRAAVCGAPALDALAQRIGALLDEELCAGRAAFATVTQQVRCRCISRLTGAYSAALQGG